MGSATGRKVAVLLPVVAFLLGWVSAAARATGRTPQGGPPEPPEQAIQREKPGLLAEKLSGPLADVEEVLFAVRSRNREWHFFAQTGYSCDEPEKEYWPTGPAMLCAVNPRTGKIRKIYEESGGTLRDPCLSYDGRKVVYSFRAPGEKVFHLWEINVDGTGRRQLTFGKFDDIEPVYLPPRPGSSDPSGIIFASARCKRYVPCMDSQVQTLYRCGPDGGKIHPLTAGVENELTPWVLPDGRVIYMRWEYVERDVRTYHHLWTVNPDGTGEMVFFGNGPEAYVSIPGGLVMLDPKGIPGTEKIVCSIDTKHRGYQGHVTIIDPAEGPDDWDGIHYVTGGYGRDVARYMDPYPVDEDTFLVSNTDNELLVMDSEGNYEVICKSPANAPIRAPQPLIARPAPPAIPDRVNPEMSTGEMVVAKAHRGRDLDGVIKPGQIKKLLVLEVLPKPIADIPDLRGGFAHNFKRVLGTVPIEDDGSAYFSVPAMRALMFVALDKDDRAIKRMRSFVTVHPGELTGCVGCHEERIRTPHPRDFSALDAVKRPASRLREIPGLPATGLIDFPRDIQPLLDKHCVSCHNHEDRKGGIVLEGDRKPGYSVSYEPLRRRSGMSGSEGGDKPYKYGSGNSPLLEQLRAGHHDVKLTAEEMNLIRLWIDSGTFWAGTFAPPRVRLRNVHADDYTGRNPSPVRIDATALKRCDRCHPTGKDNRRKKILTDETLNFTHPERSRLLLAPLARAAGGYGLCREQGSKEDDGGVFADTSAPGYRELLEEIRRIVRVAHKDDVHWDGRFVPHEAYGREMKRYGVLPEGFRPGIDALNPYAVDDRYWRLFYPGSQSSRTVSVKGRRH